MNGLISFCLYTHTHARTHAHTHTHTHTHTFNGPLYRTTRVNRYQKVKPMWIIRNQKTVSGSGISWAICKSAPRSSQITMPLFYRPNKRDFRDCLRSQRAVRVEGHSTAKDRRPRNSCHQVYYVFAAQAASTCHWKGACNFSSSYV